MIVAVPPILTGKIDYEPGLPDERVELIDHYPQGTLTKAAVVYDRPFWRDDGLTGQVLYDEGPIAATFDDSPPDASKSAPSSASSAVTRRAASRSSRSASAARP